MFSYCVIIIESKTVGGGGKLILTIGVQLGYVLHATWDIFGELLFKYLLEYYKIKIEAAVVFFGTSVGGIEEDMAEIISNCLSSYNYE